MGGFGDDQRAGLPDRSVDGVGILHLEDDPISTEGLKGFTHR